MAFRWFRKNKNATKWMYILITVFVMLTFSITGAMVDSFTGPDRSSRLAGSFRTPSGEDVEITNLDYSTVSRLLARVRGNPSEQDVWSIIMLDELGKEAGIVVSDKMIANFVRDGFPTQEDLNNFLQVTRMSEPDFKRIMRKLVRVQLYTQLNQPVMPILTEEKFHRFQEDNELLKVSYVAFTDEAEKAALESAEVSDDDLKAFFEDDIDPNVKKNDFSTPEKFQLRALVFDHGDRTAEELRAFLPEAQANVLDNQIENHRTRYPDRYPDEDEGDESEEPADEDKDGEGDEEGVDLTHDHDGDGVPDHAAEDHVDEMSPELRAEIEKDILADRVVNQAYRDFITAKGERTAAIARRDAAKEEESSEDANEDEEGDESGNDTSGDDASGDDGGADGDAAEPEPDPVADQTFDDLLDPIIEKYGLRVVEFPDAVTLEELEELDEVGSEDLQFTVRFMQAEDVRPRTSSQSVEVPYLIACSEKIDAEPLPFDEVKDELKEVWIDATASKNAQAAADAFVDALKAKAREAKQEKVDEIENRAREEAEKEIADGSIEDEEEKQKIIDAKLAAVEPEVDAVLREVMGDYYADVAGEQGLETEGIDFFRKSYTRTAFYQDEEASVEKFLKGRPDLAFLDEGQVLGPVRDDNNGAVVVARLDEKKKPTLDQMRLGDWTMAEMAVGSEKYAARSGPTGDPFSFDSLALRLALKRPEPEEPDQPSE